MLLLALAALAGQALAPAQADFFEKRVRPVLVKRCQQCHGAARQFSALRLDSGEGLTKGGKRGPAVNRANWQSSLMLAAIKRQGELKMPPDQALPATEAADLETWIKQGASWPEGDVRKPTPSMPHWAFQPVKQYEPPVVDRTTHPVDRFLRLRLHSEGLFNAPPADRRSLIRRLSFVLTGLPPTPDQVDAFLRDTSAEAYDKVVARLIESPQYGERWARHWMDVMRFGETLGYEWNYEVLGAWRYRDYLIRAFNQNLPFDQLIREHVAGDLLPQPRLNAKLGINESLIGTAFYRLGEAGHDDCVEFREICLDQVDNQIDTLGKAFQGLTVACARCHDHKIDPIPTADYYAVQGVLLSSRPVTHTLDQPGKFEKPLARLAELKKSIQQELAAVWLKQVAEAKFTVDEKAGFDSPRAALRHGEDWAAWVEKFATEAKSRAEYNSSKFTPFDDWFATGLGLSQGRSQAGEFAIAPEGSQAISGPFPAGWYSHTLSEKLNGSLRSSYLPSVDNGRKKFISLELLGGKLGALRTVIDNGQIGEVYQTIDQPELKVVRIAGQEKAKLPVYLELLTKHDNPRYPDRPGRLKKTEVPLLDQPRSFVGLRRAWTHDEEAKPKPDLSWLARLYRAEKPADAAARIRELAAQAISAWRDGKATDDDVEWIAWLESENLIVNCADASPKLRSLLAEYREAESAVPEPQTISGLGENGPGFNVPILPYGDWKNPGKTSPRGFLKLVSEGPVSAPGSGRLELAERIASPANPLTARVMVNRVWRHVFGEGLVSTPDNFGKLAEQPSHPELLDWLATEFTTHNWSVKHIVRLLVTSQAFRQSTTATAQAREKDPRNRLLQHYPVRRLDAEAIRDAILAVSGRLDRTLYGPSIDPYRTKPQDYRRLFSGPLDGYGRRSVYLKITRMEGPRFLETFDFPPPLVTRGARDVTNVPAQALTLLNDPFVQKQAEFWADRLITRRGDTIETRIDLMFQTALGRAPLSEERERFRQLIFEVADLQNLERANILAACEVWKEIAHTIFNMKEFVYLP